MTRLVIDPVTRSGGHLRVELDVAGGTVVDAWSSGSSFRGVEGLLVGRDPRDAWLLAERICGSCSGAHGLASVRAVEAALGITIPPNARLLRNLLAGITWLTDLVTGFYQRSMPDWVDVAAAASADPWAAARTASETHPDAGDTSELLSRVERQLPTLPSGLFAGDASGHPAFQLTPEADLILFAHYLRALDLQRTLAKAATTLGGKDPHPQTFLVGGMALVPPWGGPIQSGRPGHPQLPVRATPPALSPDGLRGLDALLLQVKAFVEGILVPDAVMLARGYGEWTAIARGPGSLLAYGEFPLDDRPTSRRLLPRGRLMDGRLDQIFGVDEPDITEAAAAAWYEDAETGPRRPSDGVTVPRYEGPSPPVSSLEGWPRYSYVKAPRYAGLVPMETGPLARMLVGYVQGSAPIRRAVDAVAGDAGIQVADLPSALGRLLSRAAEATVIARQLPTWMDELRTSLGTGDVAVADLSRWHPETWPREAAGFALGETPRGAVGHWVAIRDQLVSRYQVIDGSTWNLSPRDEAGRRGPLESALIGTPVADVTRPLEVVRAIHSFDPCAACAVHAFSPPATAPVATRAGESEP